MGTIGIIRKRNAHASFNKATGLEIIKDLKDNHQNVLAYFKVQEKERQYRVWQRDPLAVLMDRKNKFEQKLNYIHNDPLAERWNLVKLLQSITVPQQHFMKQGLMISVF